MKTSKLLLEVKLKSLVTNWNKLYNVFKKVQSLPTNKQIEALKKNLPGGIEDENGHILGMSEAIPKLKEMLVANHIRLDRPAEQLLAMLSYISSTTKLAKEVGVKSPEEIGRLQPAIKPF